ncbi:MAG: hypothetical protein ACOCZI_01540, partial [Marinilabiliaceae bacterium]
MDAEKRIPYLGTFYHNHFINMATLLTVISDKDDLELLMPPALALSKAFGYNILVTTFLDQDPSKKGTWPSYENVEYFTSAQNILTTIGQFTEDLNRDIQLVMLSEKAVSLRRKRKAIKKLSALRKLKVPYLIVPETVLPAWQPENIYFPLCLREGEKEASAWAGHWTKYNFSHLKIIYPVFKNPDQQKRLWTVFLFVERLLDRANIPYQTQAQGHRQKEICNTLPEILKSTGQNLIIFPTTRYYSPEYYFAGP